MKQRRKRATTLNIAIKKSNIAFNIVKNGKHHNYFVFWGHQYYFL